MWWARIWGAHPSEGGVQPTREGGGEIARQGGAEAKGGEGENNNTRREGRHTRVAAARMHHGVYHHQSTRPAHHSGAPPVRPSIHPSQPCSHVCELAADGVHDRAHALLDRHGRVGVPPHNPLNLLAVVRHLGLGKLEAVGCAGQGKAERRGQGELGSAAQALRTAARNGLRAHPAHLPTHPSPRPAPSSARTRGHDDGAVGGRDDAALPQLGQRGQRHARVRAVEHAGEVGAGGRIHQLLLARLLHNACRGRGRWWRCWWAAGQQPRCQERRRRLHSRAPPTGPARAPSVSRSASTARSMDTGSPIWMALANVVCALTGWKVSYPACARACGWRGGAGRAERGKGEARVGGAHSGRQNWPTPRAQNWHSQPPPPTPLLPLPSPTAHLVREVERVCILRLRAHQARQAVGQPQVAAHLEALLRGWGWGVGRRVGEPVNAAAAAAGRGRTVLSPTHTAPPQPCSAAPCSIPDPPAPRAL